MADLKTQRRAGFYFHNTTPYLSVTEILKVIDKPALRYWFGREVYFAMAKDPTLDEKSALSAPYNTSGSAIERGKTVHSIVESWKHTQEQIDGIPEEFRGYAEGFYNFVNDHHITIVENERTVFSHKHKYGGTLDLLAKVNGNALPHVLDVKTGKEIYEEAYFQTSAYKNALLEEGVETAGIGVILLQPDGSYKFEVKPRTDYYFETFLAAKRLYEGINHEKLKKFEYGR